MCARARLAFLLTLVATPAAAQSATDDGIRAMLRGDYRAAVRILRPLADDTTRPDPVAQFFLAILYDTGHGGDYGRACGLFLRAASPSNPFGSSRRRLRKSCRSDSATGRRCSVSSWTLGWQLIEVVRDQWILVTGERNLAIVNARAWPASYDVSSVVQLRVNANGEAELTVRGGSSPRTEVLPWKRSR